MKLQNKGSSPQDVTLPLKLFNWNRNVSFKQCCGSVQAHAPAPSLHIKRDFWGTFYLHIHKNKVAAHRKSFSSLFFFFSTHIINVCWRWYRGQRREILNKQKEEWGENWNFTDQYCCTALSFTILDAQVQPLQTILGVLSGGCVITCCQRNVLKA